MEHLKRKNYITVTSCSVHEQQCYFQDLSMYVLYLWPQDIKLVFKVLNVADILSKESENETIKVKLLTAFTLQMIF